MGVVFKGVCGVEFDRYWDIVGFCKGRVCFWCVIPCVGKRDVIWRGGLHDVCLCGYCRVCL